MLGHHPLPERVEVNQFQYTGKRNDTSVAGGLYYYGARYFDSAIGRFISADTAGPGAGNAMAHDRYAYVFNNLLSYTDPSGHRPEGEFSGDYEPPSSWLPNGGHSTFVTPPEIDLDWRGENVYELWQEFIRMSGTAYWRAYIGKWDPLIVFIAILLSHESYNVWLNGWIGADGDNGKSDFTTAANNWLWGWVKDVYHLDFGTLSTVGQRNAVFNWLGHMESVEKIYDAYLARTREKDESGNIIFGVNSAYIDLSFQDRLSKAMPAYKFNDELLSISAFTVTHPGGPYWTWRNGPIPNDAVFTYGNFYILNRYK